VIISLIVAMDEKGGIGKNNQLPWYLPGDLRRFKKLTMGHHLVMGRKTYETIGRPLPGRKMVVVTRQSNYSAPDCSIVHSIEKAIKLAKDHHEQELFIIGGGELFMQTIALANKIYLTTVHTDTFADVQFPDIDCNQWIVLDSEVTPQSVTDQYESDFKILVRKH
jgi:dihydrofolate reductase